MSPSRFATCVVFFSRTRLSGSPFGMTGLKRRPSGSNGNAHSAIDYRGFTSSSTCTMDPEITDLVNFYTERDAKEWFAPSDEFDAALKHRYASLVYQARNGDLDRLNTTPEGSLALLILLDQIPRNIFRGSKESYSSDSEAHDIAVRAIARDFDQQVGRESRNKQLLFYLPLMHAENITSQIACRALIRNVALHYTEGSKERDSFEEWTGFADRHLICIQELGRFPARNKSLGRKSTSQEIEWLKEHPWGF